MGMALQSARLFAETQAALQRQTASAEILRAIGQSPGDEAPVFDAIVGAARRLLGCFRTVLLRRDGDHLVSLRSATEGGLGPSIAPRLPLDPAHNLPSRVVLSRERLHIPDWSAVESLPHKRFVREQTGGQAALLLPLLRGDDCLGVLAFQRDRVGAFSQQDIALAESFADQAVVALDNVRLFNETREALAQQTAAAEVLNVISNSVADAEPAFKAIAGACQVLFGSDQVVLSLVDDSGLVRHERGEWPAHVPVAEAEHQWAVLNREFPRPLAQSYQAYPLRKRRVIHYPDMEHGPGLPEAMHQIAREVGNYSMLIAPMQTETRDLGTIHIVRKPPRPFSDKESALLKSFADQAVIAIQNARLFSETQEALARQTATSDVLRVISESPTDVQPVFDVIAERAAALTGARYCLVTRLDGESLHLVSLHGVSAEGTAALRAAWPQRIEGSTSIAARAIRQRAPVNVADLLAEPDADYGRR